MPENLDQRIMSGQRGEQVIGLDKLDSDFLAHVASGDWSEIWVGIQAGTYRGATNRELASAESAYLMPSMAKSICATQPEMTWPSVIGVAS